MICAVLSCLNRCNSFSRYRAIYRGGEEEKKERKKTIDDLPVLATCRSGTLVMLSSKVNGPVAHGSTRACHFNVAAIFFSGSSLHMAYYHTPW